MDEIRVTMTEFKKSLGDWVNRAAYGQAWVILMARGRPKAVIVRMEDLEELRRLRCREEGTKEGGHPGRSGHLPGGYLTAVAGSRPGSSGQRGTDSRIAGGTH